MQRKHFMRTILIMAIAALPLVTMLMVPSPVSAQRPLPPANVYDEQLDLGERPAAPPAPEASGPAATLIVDGSCTDTDSNGVCDDNVTYRLIQAAINAASSGDTISVLAGSYVENVVVNKSITLAGAGQGSTFIFPAISSPGCMSGAGSLCGNPAATSSIILVQASNVVIHGFTLDGDNTGLTSGVIANSADLDARNGIIENHHAGVYNNLEVYDTTVKNIYLRGIYVSSGGSGFNIHNTTIDNVAADPSSIALFTFGGSGQFVSNTISRANDAIAANHSKGTQFLNNVVTTSGSGIHTDNTGSGGGVADLIQGNTVSACSTGGYGIWVFVPYIAPTVNNNTISDCEVGLSAWGDGATWVSPYTPVTTLFTNNSVDGPASAANSVGVYVTTDWISWGYSDISVSFSGNVITDYETGLYFTADQQGWNPDPYVAKTITAVFLDNSIAGNIDGAGKGTSGTYNLNASGNWWGSNVPATVATTVGAGIDYTPWLAVGTDTNGAAGFQGDFSTLWVDDDSPQTGSTGRVQEGVNLVTVSTVNVAAGTYDEDVNLNKSLSLIGAGAASTTIRGVIGGDGATVRIAASNVTVAGFTLTRLGNNTTDWNDAGLNFAGVAIQGAQTGTIIRDNILTGNRTGIDINNSSGHTIRNNAIIFNRTGLLFRNQTDNMTVVENEITDNWTVGVLFLDASSGSNSPVQTALNSNFSNNDISGNWYGQVVDRQSGGSLPTPGTTNLKNFSGNWLGTITPVVSIANSAEPGYAAQIPVAYGGTAVPPGGQPDILGPASANFDFTPFLASGADTDVETTGGRGTFGFQGDFANLWVTAVGAQTGSTGRIQEGVNLVSGSMVNVAAGSYPGNVLLNKSVMLRGAQYGVNVSGRTAGAATESTVTGLMTVDASNVEIDGFTLTNPGQTYAVNVDNTPAHSGIAITYNIVDNVGDVGLGSNVHAVIVSDGADSVTIAHNRFNNIKAGAKSVSAVGVLQSVSTDQSTGLVIQDNTFSDIASATKGAYGVILNNGAGTPGAQIKDNTFSGLNGGWTHAIGLEGPTPNAVVTGNIFSNLTAAGADKAAVLFEKNISGGTVNVECNQFNGTAFYGVAIHPNDLPGGSNGYNYVVDAEKNWWGNASGPNDPVSNPSGTGALVGPKVDYDPWLITNVGCASGTGNWQNQTTMAYDDLQGSLDDASYGDEIKFVGTGPIAGGATSNTNGVTINLNGGTFGPGSPFLTVNSADMTVVGPGTLDGNGSLDPAILVITGGNNLILNGVEIREWADGVEVANSVTSFKLVNNWIHSNTDAGLQVDLGVTLSGVVTIQGNLFKVNGGNGVQNNSGNSLNATYNSWGADGGPLVTGGDGVSANVTFDPWTFAEVYIDVDPAISGDQFVRGVDESTSFNVALNVDGENLYGLSFKFTYNPAYITFNGPPTFQAPWAGNCSGTPSVGTFTYTCYLISGPAWDGGTVATFNFTANGPDLTGDGSWTTYFDVSHLAADTNTGAQGGVKVFVNNAGFNDASVMPYRNITDTNDGQINITGVAQFTGFVDVQGRPNDSGALVQVYNQSTTTGATLLASGTSASSGKYTTSYVNPNLLTVGTTYYFQVDRSLYLPTTVKYPSLAANWAQSKPLTTRPLTSLATFVLLGGDATNDDTIDILDGGCIGPAYGGAPVVCNVTGNSDVNGDGATNILDLVLFGGNYGLFASPWTP